VLSDNVGGMQEIVRYVYSNGHRRIAFIHGEDTSVTQKRIASFFKACSEFDLRIPEAYVRACYLPRPALERPCHARSARASRTADLHPLPDDFSFIGGMNELERQGLSIPDDMSVVGYDGICFLRCCGQSSQPSVRTRKPWAEKAAALLVEQIENPKSWLPQSVTVSGTLLEGHSVKTLNI
jgi:LacI family transcriptional regulator